MLSIWILVFVAALFILVKGADALLGSAEKIGLNFGLSPFVVGVLIVGVGTSLPELASSVAAVFQGVPEVVVANVVGSNIANILLVVGLAAIIGRGIAVTKDLIDSELPMLAVSTVIFLSVVFNGSISFAEAIILVFAYLVYLFYTMDGEGDESQKIFELPGGRPSVRWTDYALLFLGIVGLTIGAKYTIDSVIALSKMLHIAPGVVSITAIALGTSLPELLVSIKAARKGQAEIAVGNILGSNAFNVMMVVGVPALFTTLPIDEKTFSLGVPAMALATLIFIISGISRRIYRWEGMMFLLFYVLFILNLFGVA